MTGTDCATFAPETLVAQLRPQLTAACLPMVALVLMGSTLIEPDRLIAAPAANPRLTPTAAMSSLLVAVTATPLKLCTPCPTFCGPIWPASAAGGLPDLAMLCERPVEPPVRPMSEPLGASRTLTH